MYLLKYKLPLKVLLNTPIKKNGYETYELYLNELEFNKINSYDIEKLDGQYDWIDAWVNSEYDKKWLGLTTKMC